MTVAAWAWLVLLAPLAGSLIIAAGFRVLSKRAAGWIGTAAIGVAFIAAIGTLLSLLDLPAENGGREVVSTAWQYAAAGPFDIELNILVDPLSVFMCLVVTGCSTLIHLYSVSYMTSDQGFNRYFSYLNFFVFSMLLLVLAGNFVLLVVGWAFVGFASYALISFWYRRSTATAAGMKAFVINVIGDIGLVLAAFLIFREFGSANYLDVYHGAHDTLSLNSGVGIAICALLLVGAFAKSAQLPLHTWLPDAMEGPTPVSSLIHAATMVTAGVYLIARSWPLFEMTPTMADISAIIGLATLTVAATIALVVTDLKRIIAYSTMSQIGYMVVGVSIGAYTAGLFHLMTHAFFKALLFMAAGSIIGAMAGLQNIDRMSGMRRALPFTTLMLIIGALALAGFPGTSGFFSKDEIISVALERGGFYTIFAIGGYIVAFLTAFYSFRIGFRVVAGRPCDEARELEQGHLAHAEHVNPATGEPEDTDVGFPGSEHHIAEREMPMKIAMSLLAVGAIFGGVLQIPGVSHVLETFFEPTFEGSHLFHIVPSASSAWVGLAIGAVISIAGIALAWYCYVARPGVTLKLRDRFSGIHNFLQHAWYFNELIDLLVYRPLIATGRFCNRFIERFIVDGIVVAATSAVRGVSGAVRQAQSGLLRAYALLVVAGVVALGLYFLLVAGS